MNEQFESINRYDAIVVSSDVFKKVSEAVDGIIKTITSEYLPPNTAFMIKQPALFDIPFNLTTAFIPSDRSEFRTMLASHRFRLPTSALDRAGVMLTICDPEPMRYNRKQMRFAKIRERQRKTRIDSMIHKFFNRRWFMRA